MRRWALAAVSLAMSLLLVGCGSAAADQNSALAGTIVQALRAGGLPLDSVGRCAAGSPGAPADPGAVVVAFHDRRLPGPQDPRRVTDGGVIEVLAGPPQAEARRAQLAEQVLIAGEFGYDEGGQPLVDEHVVVTGRVVLRLAGILSEEQVSAYRTALAHPPHGDDEPGPWPTIRCLT
ncbi:hypothetical protein ACQPZQ_21195 [Pseudonocardia sp. CA-142604]|uniref:hypothetical protein n=1 Tax=Pseudonocardia sp. CA-142604 TaxID=3240024 RepID=UPI003D8EDDA2